MIKVYAIFLGSYGYKPIDYEGEEQTFELDYVLVDELPDELRNIPEGHYAHVDVVDGEIVVTYVEVPAVPEPEDELTALKLAMAEMAVAHEQEKVEMQLAIAELASIVTGGNADA